MQESIALSTTSAIWRLCGPRSCAHQDEDAAKRVIEGTRFAIKGAKAVQAGM